MNNIPVGQESINFSSIRLLKDKIANKLMLFLTIFAGSVVLFIIIGLYGKSRPILASNNLSELLLSTTWQPLKGKFGFSPFIMGTLWVTLTAIIIAMPVCFLTAIYLSEYAHAKLRSWIKPFIDLLAGIPSVVYGLWGVLIIVPFVKEYIARPFGVFTSGYNVLSGGIILAIMIFPVIINILLEVFESVPHQVKEASLALGATKWQTVKYVIIRKALPGIIAAVVLGLSRALGETMAVLMVVGNVAKLPRSFFDPAYPLPALIANNYGEMLSVPLYDSALMLASLFLLCIVLFFNIASRFILTKVEANIC